MKVDIKSIIFLVVTAIFLFPLKIKNIEYITYITIYLIPSIYILTNIEKIKSYYFKYPLNIIISTSTIWITAISIIWPAVFETYDYTYLDIFIKRSALLTIKITFLVLLFINIYKEKASVELYTKVFVKAIILYIITSLITIAFPNIREFFLSTVSLSEKNISDLSNPYYYTRFGWGGWAGFDETMICTIGVLLSSYQIINNTEYKKQALFFIYSLILLLGNMFYGRSGVIASLMIIMVTLLVAVKKRNKQICLLAIKIFSLFTLFINIIIVNNNSFENWYDWVFSIFIRFLETGELSDNMGSLSMLLNHMYWIPKSETLFFGDARYTELDGSYYLTTDAGIMRNILFFGMFNYIIYILFFIVGSKKIIEASFLRSRNKSIMLIMMILVATFFEIKGHGIEKIIIYIFPLYIISKYKN